MRSLVNAPVLALDLARHPAGGLVCDVLDRVLVLGAADHQALLQVALGPADPVRADPVPADPVRAGDPDRTAARRRLLAVAGRQPFLADALADTARALSGESGGPERRGAPGALSAVLVGRLLDVHAMLLADGPLTGPDVPAEVVGVVLDAVTATWTAPDPAADPVDVALLLAPWREALPAFPTSTPEAAPGGRYALLDLLDAVARSSPVQWAGLDAAHGARHGPLAWSSGLHEACRVAAAAGRTTSAARWQLAAARTAHGRGPAARGSAPGAMMSVVAAVQAVCVGDLIAPDLAAALTGPCRTVLGWSP